MTALPVAQGSQRALRPLLSPLEVHSLVHTSATRIPDIIEFTCSDKYLNKGNIYPRQGTLLKVIFLQDELFCADEETEILTRRGWKRYWEVVEGEDVLTLRQDGSAEWSPAERVNVFPVQDTPVVHMEGEGHSSVTTPNHRWLVEHLYQRKAGWVRQTEFRTTEQLSGADRIAGAAPVVGLPQRSVWLDDFVELVSWYYTEGHALVGSRGVNISQSGSVNPEYVERIRSVLTRLYGPPALGFDYTDKPAWREDGPDESGVVCFHLNHVIGGELRWIAPGHEKIVREDFIASLTETQLMLFIETSIDADGWRKTLKHSVSRRITQRSKRRLDSLQMACSLAGLRTSLREAPIRSGKWQGSPRWRLTINAGDRRYFSPQVGSKKGSRGGFSITHTTHTGHLWCPTTANGTWLARRNGSTYFTGNTEYDLDVIGHWEETFLRTGNEGISPGILDRIKINKAQGRSWFREVLAAIGRRGGKGHVGGIAGAYVLWHYMHRPGGPQAYYGIDRDKRLTALVFAGKKEQAIANQWRDLTNTVASGPCFAPYISRHLGSIMTVMSPMDLLKVQNQQLSGVNSEQDPATFELLPSASTMMAGRGPASFCLDPETPVLKADLTWVPIKDLREGDEVVGVDEHPIEKGQQRKLRRAVVEKSWGTRKPALRLTFNDGSSVVCSEDHQWLVKEKGAGGTYKWRQAQALTVGRQVRALVDPWEYDETRGAGWLAGFFDGEGCVSGWKDRAGRDVLVSQNPGTTLEHALSLLRERGMNFIPHGYSGTRVQQWKAPSAVDAMRFLGAIRPERLMPKAASVWEGVALRGGRTPSGRESTSASKTIVSVEHLPEQDLVDIQTSTGTFIANGLVSHNCQMYDEMAHIIATGANRDAEAIYNAGTPSLDQFGIDGFIYAGSSPWQMQGKFYDNAQLAIEKNPDGTPAYPAMLLVQLPSWGPYEDWRHAHEIPMAPRRDIPRGKRARTYIHIKRPIQQYDENMRLLEKANPETFKVERRSHWSESLVAYLDPKKIKEAFGPWQGKPLTMVSRGRLSRYYKAHGDPGHVNDSFGFSIAHVEQPEGEALPHVVFDFIKRWKPQDFDDSKIDYLVVSEDIKGYIDSLLIDDLSLDQWNSIMAIALLNKHIAEASLPKRIRVWERTATRASNWKEAETFKAALNLGLVHAPMLNAEAEPSDDAEWAELELRFLEDKGGKVEHPSSGPVQNDDIANSMMAVVYSLIGEQLQPFLSGEVPLGGSLQGGTLATSKREAQQDPGDALAGLTRPSRAGMGNNRARGMRRR